MSRELFNRSADLKRLREEGYCVEVVGGCLLMRDVPYVGPDRKIHLGNLVSELNVAGEQTRKPSSHQVDFVGESPCDADGKPLKMNDRKISKKLANGMLATHSFSRKPGRPYVDYHEKLTTYAHVLSQHAKVIDASVTAQSLREPTKDEPTVFKYTETASGRVGIGEVTRRLESDVIAIIGLGGTGSYVLDQVAKTPVREIRLFDADIFLQHNAFRAPGAASLEELRDLMPKVEYFAKKYSAMRQGIVPHTVALNQSNLHLLDGVTFAFICMDAGEAKKQIVGKLELLDASFSDVGMGLDLVDGSLGGVLRVTSSTPGNREQMHSGVVSFQGGGEDDLYATNIQVADLNAFNALLAVMQWKKIRRFYRDLKGQHHSTFTVDTGKIAIGEDGK